MLVGAAALAIRGLSRGTHDVDFMTLDPGVLQLDWSEDLSGDTVIEPRLDDLDDPLAGVVTFSREGSTDVDLVVARWKWQQQVIDRSEPTDLEVFTVRVPDVEDLVLLKIEAGGFLDQRDAAQLIEIHGPEVIGRVDRRVLDLPEPMQQAWQRVRDEILER
ncbi:MAG TPA: hypothetical protein VM534_01935 [Thermoanaerobaculia bacterium]|nr:hypothetical protein [Thermoanaerobaculia bacterium]